MKATNISQPKPPQCCYSLTNRASRPGIPVCSILFLSGCAVSFNDWPSASGATGGTIAAVGGSQSGGSPSNGGGSSTIGVGGSANTSVGGTPTSAGGSGHVGGAASTAGVANSGGNSSAGTTSAAGGTTNGIGGANSTGGAVGNTTLATTAQVGGTTANGGGQSSGGTPSIGGTTTIGGSINGGGTQAVGGATTAGGTATTGGTVAAVGGSQSGGSANTGGASAPGGSGASGGTSAAPGGNSSTGGNTACGPSCTSSSVIDDFEDGDTTACPRSNWNISWWLATDGYGTLIAPASGANADLQAALLPPRGTSCRGLHLQGQDFYDWGAMIGLVFNSPTNSTPLAVDLGTHTGVSFWIRGSGAMRLEMATTDTALPSEGGTCTGDCDHQFASSYTTLLSTWANVQVTFSSLYSDTMGRTLIASDLGKALTLQFRVAAGSTFDLWLDDVSWLP